MRAPDGSGVNTAPPFTVLLRGWWSPQNHVPVLTCSPDFIVFFVFKKQRGRRVGIAQSRWVLLSQLSQQTSLSLTVDRLRQEEEGCGERFFLRQAEVAKDGSEECGWSGLAFVSVE